MPRSHDAPPETLDRALEVGPGDWHGPAFYQLMTALVIPRPIGWISTISAKGVRNIAPYSYFNLMGSDPFYVAFGSTGVKDSLSNLREVPEFVANIVTGPNFHRPSDSSLLASGNWSESRNSARDISSLVDRVRLKTCRSGTCRTSA